ncbi:MAG: septal ring lytic transglycosylase RlpA family protein, partial [Treponema sp.]|nr:septal ring lytic transglycosylase RlpA family protein [Treponema sp.]
MKKLFLIAALALTLIAPTFADYVYKSTAVASYDADKFHGRKTSNGEIFNMYALTAAHKTLPFNTKVKVTNLTNGKSVIVRINDRGPFVKGREIDLSKAAASKLDMIKSGTAKVKLT